MIQDYIVGQVHSGLIPNDPSYATSNLAILQTAIDRSYVEGRRVIIDDMYYISGSLTLRGGEHVKGIRAIRTDGKCAGLKITAAQPIFKNYNTSYKRFYVRIEDLYLYSTVPGATGVDATNFSHSQFRGLYFHNLATGMKVISNHTNGSELVDVDVKAYQCGQAFVAEGVTGMVADCHLDVLAQECTSGPAIEIKTDVVRCTLRGRYKQSAVNTLSTGAIVVRSGATLNALVACGGEVNQSVPELLIESGAQLNQVFGFMAQSASRISVNDSTSVIYGSQS